MELMKAPWWLKPHKFLFFFIVPLYVIIFFVKPTDENYFSFKYFLMGLVYLSLLASFALLGSRTSTRSQPERFIVRRGYLDFLAIVTIAAYVMWFGKVFVHPVVFMNILLGRMGTDGVRYYVHTIPGITTLAQFGVVYTIFYLNQKSQPDIKARKRYQLYFMFVLLLAIFRVIAWSEREAIIELIVPIVMISTLNYRGMRFQKTIKYAPILGILVLYVFFAVTEYFRSWTYYKYVYRNYFQFVTQRLLDYYYTSLNNGAGILQFYHWPTFNFQNTLAWVYAFPGVGKSIANGYGIYSYATQFLFDYASPQFNNWSGIFTVFQDIGIPLTFVFAAILGTTIGIMYRGFVKRDGLGVALYPVLFMSILEVMRMLYISNQRAFPVILGILIGFIFFKQKCVASGADILKVRRQPHCMEGKNNNITFQDDHLGRGRTGVN